MYSLLLYKESRNENKSLNQNDIFCKITIKVYKTRIMDIRKSYLTNFFIVKAIYFMTVSGSFLQRSVYDVLEY